MMEQAQIAAGSHGSVPPDGDPAPLDLACARWVVHDPQGLITGERGDALGWRVTTDGQGYIISVPAYAYPGRGYQVRHTDWQGRNRHAYFEVVQCPNTPKAS